MRRICYTVLFVAVGVAVGKWCQYTAVDYLGSRLGFELASLVGLVPFLAILIMMKGRFPRYFTFKRSSGHVR
jgi:hypothetical protein